MAENLLNKVLILLLNKQYHARVAEWDTNYWTPYLDLCRKQEYEAELVKIDEEIDKIYIHSTTTGTTVGRFCVHNADVTELGTVLGSPGSYEPVFDSWARFVRKFYRVDVTKFKPAYVIQKRRTLA